MNSEAIKGRLSQHVKRRLQSQESIDNKSLSSQTHQPSAAVPIPVVIRSQIKQEDETEITPVKSVKKRKMTKKSSSSHSVESNPDEDDRCDNRSSDKVDTSLDVLTLILNHKKSEFLRNPAIVELLCDMNKRKCGTALSELIQS